MIKPYVWQQKNIDKLRPLIEAGHFTMDTSDTGTGKTIVSLQLMKDLNRRTLVICPKAVHTAWERTAMAMGCDHLLYGIVNAERLQYKNPYVKGLDWLIPKDVWVIWDEVHKGASGTKSKTTKILAATKPQGIQVHAMSATIATSPLNMRAIGYLADLHQFKMSSFWDWCLKNGCFRAAYANNAIVFPKGPKAQRIMESIGDKLRPFTARVRIQDIPEFPETSIVANLYDLDAKYKKEIIEAYADMDEEIRKPNANPLVERTRARQRTELCKIHLLKDLIYEAIEEGKSVVVFLNYKESLTELSNMITFDHRLIKGGQSREERQTAIDDFQNDTVNIVLCMIQAGGVGISLHGLPGKRERVSLITPSDSASEFVQALGRIHRAGGSKTIQTIVLASETVEEKIHANIQGKLHNLNSLLDGDLQGG